MRILILNWRCQRHPRAGGAELLTHEVAKRLVAAGHTVEWFCAAFPGAAHEEQLDGIRIIRAGNQWTVHWRAFRHYRGSLRGKFDVVVDEVNTMPFFTPMWAGIPVLMLIFQLAREVWWYESQFPISAIGYAIEPIYLTRYCQTPAVTISRSTETDLRTLGFKSAITVMPIGIDNMSTNPAPKADTASFLYVGRLAPSKRIGHLFQALAQFRRATGTGTLALVGKGSVTYQRSLVKLAYRLGIQDSVVFVGVATPNEKHELMARSHALLMTSVREGWGLVVTEAGACGTPAVVYDVPGLRDSVRHERTGLIVAPRPNSLFTGMMRLMNDPALYARLATEGRGWSLTFSFDRAALVLGQALEGALAA